MKRRLVFVTITIIIVTMVYFIKSTNSRYISEANIDGNVEVAIPQIEIDTSNCILPELMFPGDTQQSYFYIRNYTDSKINEVLMEYYINVNITKSDIPLTYKIYEVSGTTETELALSTSGFRANTIKLWN